MAGPAAMSGLIGLIEDGALDPGAYRGDPGEDRGQWRRQ
jgi:hypothetical protein